MKSLSRVKAMSDADIQDWLTKIGTTYAKDLEIALLDSDEEVKRRICSNMSDRASSALEADLKKLSSSGISPKEMRAKAEMLEAWM
jgi:flagellar motor switch protein FliG